MFAEYELQIRHVVTAGQRGSSQPGQVGINSSRLLHTSAACLADSTSTGGASMGGAGDDSGESNKEGKTSRERLKAAVRDYGSTVVIFHISISLASLGFFYTLVAR